MMLFRLQKHLYNCQKAYKGDDIGICRFNIGHHVHKDEMAEHEQKCPDRVVVEKIALASAKRQHDAVETRKERQSPPEEDDVDEWDQVRAVLSFRDIR